MILIVFIMLYLCVILTVWFFYLHKYNQSQGVSRKQRTKKAYRITYNNCSPKNKRNNYILTAQFSLGKQHKKYVTHEVISRNIHNSGLQLTVAPKITGRYYKVIHIQLEINKF